MEKPAAFERKHVETDQGPDGHSGQGIRVAVMDEILSKRIIAIMRGIEPKSCITLARALWEGGIHLIEVTFDQKDPATFHDTARAIQAIQEDPGCGALVGAGTVTTPGLVDLAAEAGAKYIVSPDTNPHVIARTLENGLVSIPGAMTPTEIMAAHNLGADFVKLFPVSQLGIDYIKAICAPISHVKLLATGGVNEENITGFIRAGAVGAGVGGNLVNKAWIAEGRFDRITALAKELVTAVDF